MKVEYEEADINIPDERVRSIVRHAYDRGDRIGVQCRTHDHLDTGPFALFKYQSITSWLIARQHLPVAQVVLE